MAVFFLVERFCPDGQHLSFLRLQRRRGPILRERRLPTRPAAAGKNTTLVYGSGAVGLMGVVADAAVEGARK